jgi:hypothetical protein
MAGIRIDTSNLTYKNFLISGLSTELIDGSQAPTIQIEPGQYNFQQSPANFTFRVTSDGLVDYDDGNDVFLDGRGTSTLTVKGFSITLDARPLSHNLLPIILGASSLARDQVHPLTLLPASGYGFQPASGIVADFQFSLDGNGQLMVDPQYAGFASVSGQTLTIHGYQVTIDGRQLSHGLVFLNVGTELPHDRTHILTLIPAAGYGFQPASGIVAEFQFAVTTNGQVVVGPQYTGFASVDGQTLTIHGYQVTIDGRQLSHGLVFLNVGTELAQDRTHVLTLIPAAGYGFQPGSGIVAEFQFAVTTNGQVVVGSQYTGFASADGKTLTIRGYKITIDARKLSHALMPISLFGGANVLSQDSTHELTLIPAAGHVFMIGQGLFADFRFSLNVNGQLVLNPQYAGFASVSGQTLTINGYPVTIDGRQLSHALMPYLMLGLIRELSRDLTHELTLIPATGYRFQIGSGIVAEFQFGLDVNGQVVVDPQYAGFAAAIDRILTINGYQVTIDGRQLSHALMPDAVFGLAKELAQDRTHTLTLIPGAGYGFLPAPGLTADFQFVVGVNGQLVMDSQYAEFAEVSERALTVRGYPVTIDGRNLQHDLAPQLLGNTNILLRDRVHEMKLIPVRAGTHYILRPHGGPTAEYKLNLDTAGRINLQDVPAELIIKRPAPSSGAGRFCSVPDPGGPIDPLTFGSPGGRWSRGNLRVSINPTGCNFVNAPGANLTAVGLITNAFTLWQAVSPFFTFTQLPPNVPADIRVVFGNQSVDPSFGAAGGVAGSARYPESGNIQFDSAETWSAGALPNTINLLAAAIHEVGHALGLSHSNQPGGTMYPFQTPAVIVDVESQNALRAMYDWTPQQALGDRGTSDRATLGVTRSSNFGGVTIIPRMAWKGVGGDSSIYESELQAGGWTPQRRIANIGSSHSPSLASIPAPGPVPQTGLLMAWTGAPGDQGLYWSRDLGSGWETQRRIPGVGSSTRPALANAAGSVWMAWKGAGDDSGIYYSAFDGVGAWSPQARINGVGTSDTPALVGVGNRLFMFWKGIAGDSTAYWSVIDFVSEPIWRPQRRIEYFSYDTGGGISHAIGTSGGLTATPRGNSILVAWKGAPGDSGIYVSLFADNEFGGQIRVANIGTSIGPSVVDMNGTTLMAWKGAEGDSAIYWSQL